MKYLIVGLGNPGEEYLNTRHNIGFKVLDELASSSNANFSSDKYAETCEINYKGRKLILVKPNTFMNLSGKSVNYWLQKTKIKKEKLLIITDDLSLPLGTLRLRKKGSSGGHNGLKDIECVLNSNEYSRLRFGIGNDYNRGQQVRYVLGDFLEEDQSLLGNKIQNAITIIQAFTTLGIDKVMTEFNRK